MGVAKLVGYQRRNLLMKVYALLLLASICVQAAIHDPILGDIVPEEYDSADFDDIAWADDASLMQGDVSDQDPSQNRAAIGSKQLKALESSVVGTGLLNLDAKKIKAGVSKLKAGQIKPKQTQTKLQKFRARATRRNSLVTKNVQSMG